MSHTPEFVLSVTHLFTADELKDLAELLAKVRGTAAALGMAMLRDAWARTVRRHQRTLREAVGDPDGLMLPEDALEYFRSLVPTLGRDPQRFGEDQRRTAFTLARTTDGELLARVQRVVAEALDRGSGTREAGLSVEKVLDAAGLSDKGGYAEMVARTNILDSYNQGAWDEMREPDVQETFPAWRYSNPADSRSRPEHAAKDGLFWSASVPFAVVRGMSIAEIANCRCTFIPVDKWDLERLKSQGIEIRTAP